MEAVLENAMINVGGSIESLEKALDAIASQPAKGPKDAVIHDILDQLLTFDSFTAFSDMMSSAAENEEYQREHQSHSRPQEVLSRNARESKSTSDGPGRFQSTLLTMGFSEDLIEMVMDSAPEDSSLEQLVMMLSELQSQV